MCGCGVCEPGSVGGVWWGVGVRLRAGEGEFCRMGGQCGWELGWELEDGGRLEGGPPPTLGGPREPGGAPGPVAVEPGWAAGLLTGREGGVDIWFCWGAPQGRGEEG